jgi:exonuclease III
LPEVYYTNLRSLLNKIDLINFHLNDQKYKILLFSETWLTKKVDDRLILTDKPYNLYRSDRTKGRGGGTAALIHSSITSSLIASIFDQNINLLCIDLLFIRKIRLIIIYVPPSSTHTNKHLDKLINILSLYLNVDYPLIICGDFNFNSKNAKTPQFLEFMTNLSLTQLVDNPTRGDAILDLIFASDPRLITNLKHLDPLGNSDHSALAFRIQDKFIKFQHLKNMSLILN